ncbi:Ig-like domain-containing protein [Synechococcus sp. PCC 7336]|uniref:Ig-like domain-containing protein n=1 Tax=Synechococcus sp. PCC 7336 TaxID=195250 RepID=UPI00034BBE6E|nr:Ig-like domain-containing protein [Synechococcus sp. PCC 7336]
MPALPTTSYPLAMNLDRSVNGTSNIPAGPFDLDNSSIDLAGGHSSGSSLQLSTETLTLSSFSVLSSPNIIDGTAGVDVLGGFSEADVMAGTVATADDIITGFGSGDLLTGNGGNDTFVYTSLSDRIDTITDFTTASAGLPDEADLIDLTDLLSSLGVTGQGALGSGFVNFFEVSFGTYITIDPTGANGAGGIIPLALVRGVSEADLNDPNNFLPLVAAPDAVADAFDVTGNIGIDVDFSGSLLGNDTGDAFTLTSFGATAGTAGGTVANGANTVSTSNGGSVVLNSDGTFTYDPGAGFTGTDSFFYTLENGGGFDVAEVTLAVSDLIWFIDSGTGGSSDGTLANPFTSIADFNAVNNGAGNNPGVGDNIFLATGAGTYTDGIILQDNQTLLGQGVAGTTLDAEFGITLAAFSNSLPSINGIRPTISNGSGDGISLAAGNTIRGLDIGDAAGFGISGAAVGNLTIGEVSLNNTLGGGFNVGTSGNLGVTFDSLSSGGGTNGVNLVGTTGSFAANGGSIGGSSGTAFNVNGGTANVTYEGTLSQTNAASTVAVSNKTGGTVDFNGAIIANTGTATAINLTNNTSTAVNFDGGLDIDTASGTGFNAIGGGTVNVTGASNTINTTNGIGLNLAGTTLGASGVTFQSISASGGSEGILIRNGGTTGFFTVTGSGSIDGSGGTIQNTTTNGIRIENTNNVTLNNMTLLNANTTDTAANTNAALELTDIIDVDIDNLSISGTTEDHGIFATNVTDFDLSNSTIQSAGNGLNEHGIFLVDLRGTAAAGTANTIANTDVLESGTHNIFVNNTGATDPGNLANPDQLTIIGGRILGLGLTPGTTQTSGLLIQTSGNANLDARISGTTFERNAANAINYAVSGNSDVQTRVENSQFLQGVDQQFSGIVGGITDTASFQFVFDNNNITVGETGGAEPSGINISAGDTATVSGTSSNNTITGGSIVGIQFVQQGDGLMVVAIDNNNITLSGSTNGSGIELEAESGSGTLSATVTNNTIVNSNTGFLTNGIFLQAGNGDAGESSTLCVNITGNDVSIPNVPANGEYALQQFVNNTFQLQGFMGAANDAAAVLSFVELNNVAGDAVLDPTFVNYTNATCATP